VNAQDPGSVVDKVTTSLKVMAGHIYQGEGLITSATVFAGAISSEKKRGRAQVPGDWRVRWLSARLVIIGHRADLSRTCHETIPAARLLHAE
jgi:hypothetical protein